MSQIRKYLIVIVLLIFNIIVLGILFKSDYPMSFFYVFAIEAFILIWFANKLFNWLKPKKRLPENQKIKNFWIQ